MPSTAGRAGFPPDCAPIGVLGRWRGEFDAFRHRLFQPLHLHVQRLGAVGVAPGNLGESVGHGDEGLHQPWVEFTAGAGLDQQHRLGMRQRRPVGVPAGQFIVAVGQGDDPRRQGNPLARKAFRKAPAILAFVMTVGDLPGEAEESGRLAEPPLGAGQGVAPGAGMAL